MQQANILSFDDAKRSSAASASTSVRSHQRSTRSTQSRRRGSTHVGAPQSQNHNRVSAYDFERKTAQRPAGNSSVRSTRAESRNSHLSGKAKEQRFTSRGRTFASDGHTSDRRTSARKERASENRFTETSTRDSYRARAVHRSDNRALTSSHEAERHRASRDTTGRETLGSSYLGGLTPFDSELSSSRPNRNSKNSNVIQQQNTPHKAVMSYDDFLEDEQSENLEDHNSNAAGQRSKKQGLSQKYASYKKKRAKEKAEKAFTKQFGGTSPTSQGTQSSSPRAAVYKGEMGPAQRRAQRMQPNNASDKNNRASKAAAAAAKQSQGGFMGRFASVAGGISNAITSRFLGEPAHSSSVRNGHRGIAGFSTNATGGTVAATGARNKNGAATSSILSRIGAFFFGTKVRTAMVSVTAFLLVAGVFMYPAAKQYYTEMRHLDQVQAEYQAVVDRNAQLASTRDYLQSDEGVKEMAHEKYGWVDEGDNSVLVYGLPDDGTLADTNLYIKRGSVSAPETWYSVILDPLFGVE